MNSQLLGSVRLAKKAGQKTYKNTVLLGGNPKPAWLVACQVRCLALQLIIALVSTILGAQAFALNIESLASPNEAQLSWVGKNIVQNGMPMQIVEFRSTQSLQSVLAFYREEWRQYHQPGQRSTVANQLDGWDVLSTLIDGHNVVLQVKSEAGLTTGFISATPLGQVTHQSDVARAFPRQWGTTLMSAMESTDGDVTATTLILQSNQSVREMQRYYKTAFLRNGWVLARSSEQQDTAVMLFDRRDGSMELAVRREHNKTLIFANIKGGI